VKRTMSGEVIAGVAGHAEMPHFGVPKPMKDPALDHGSNSDAGAHGHVHECFQIASGAPAAFGQRGGVDVSVEPHRHAERAAD
jgi:hypothetical protein